MYVVRRRKSFEKYWFWQTIATSSKLTRVSNVHLLHIKMAKFVRPITMKSAENKQVKQFHIDISVKYSNICIWTPWLFMGLLLKIVEPLLCRFEIIQV